MAPLSTILTDETLRLLLAVLSASAAKPIPRQWYVMICITELSIKLLTAGTVLRISTSAPPISAEGMYSFFMNGTCVLIMFPSSIAMNSIAS